MLQPSAVRILLGPKYLDAASAVGIVDLGCGCGKFVVQGRSTYHFLRVFTVLFHVMGASVFGIPQSSACSWSRTCEKPGGDWMGSNEETEAEQ